VNKMNFLFPAKLSSGS